MRRNRLRELLKADQPSLGTHIHSSWPTIIELVGHSGMFDYVEFVGEYARTISMPWRTSAGRRSVRPHDRR